jgi:hypothetical protein
MKKFRNCEAKLIVCIADWRLGSFEFAFSKTSKESVEILKSTQSFQNTKAIPPEYTVNNVHFLFFLFFIMIVIYSSFLGFTLLLNT